MYLKAVVFFKQKTAYEMRISDWRSDVCSSVLLALLALQQGQSLVLAAEERVGAASEDYDGVVAERRLLPPLDHPDPAHCLVSGTGLTHLGSADARDAMHRKVAEEGEAALSDSMKMFKWGVDGGRTRTEEQTSELQSLMR